jgi:hypothetical protein
MQNKRCNRCANCAAVEKAQRQMFAIMSAAPVGAAAFDDGVVAVWNRVVEENPCAEEEASNG